MLNFANPIKRDIYVMSEENEVNWANRRVLTASSADISDQYVMTWLAERGLRNGESVHRCKCDVLESMVQILPSATFPHSGVMNRFR